MAKSKSKTEDSGKKRRKAADERKEEFVRVRLTSEQKELLTKAAEKVGLDVSSWLRSVGIERARDVLKGD